MKAPPRTDFGVSSRIFASTPSAWSGSSESPWTGALNAQAAGPFLSETSMTFCFSRQRFSHALPPPERTI